MGKLWDGAEFFRMMAANEQAVSDWYIKLAQDAKFGGKFFEKLAKDEDRHYGIYTALLKKYEADKGLAVNVDDEHLDYLNLLMHDNIMSDPDKLLAKAAKASTRDDIFDLAERVERDSVLFVEEIMDLYPDVAPEDLKVVLKEEKDHLRQVMSRRMQSQMDNLKM